MQQTHPSFQITPEAGEDAERLELPPNQLSLLSPLSCPRRAPVLLTTHLSIFLPGPLIEQLGLYILTDTFFFFLAGDVRTAGQFSEIIFWLSLGQQG